MTPLLSIGALVTVFVLVLGLVVAPGTSAFAEGSFPEAPASSSDLPGASDGPSVLNADADLELTISQATGTAPFSDDDEAGNDSGPDNDIVRTNDTIAFTLGVRFEGADQSNPVVNFTVPQGQELVSLPPFCQPGSSVTPPSLPPPAVPLTQDSWEDLPQQHVVCALRDETAGTALNYPFVTKVRSEVPHGTVMDPMVFTVSSDQVPEPVVSDPMTQRVSAKANYDLSKQRFFAPGAGACAGNETERCLSYSYGFSITVPNDGKGSAPLADPISFTDNVQPESFYGQEVWDAMVLDAGSEADARDLYAPQFVGCSSVSGGVSRNLPFSSLGNESNAVRDSGTFNCPSAAPGENVTITLNGVDTSAYTVPQTYGDGTAIEAGLGFIAAGTVRIQFPQTAILRFGTEVAPGDYRLDTHNEFTDVEFTDLNGEAVEEDPSNNHRDYRGIIRVNRGNVGKGFVGIHGQERNTPASQFGRGEGPPGSYAYQDGNTQVMPGQAVHSRLVTDGTGIEGTETEFSWSTVACDVWDADRLALAAHPDWHYSGGYHSGGEPVFRISNNPTVKNFTIEYSAGPAGPGADADCSTGEWFDDPSDIVTPVIDDHGRSRWEGVNRVRYSYHTEFPAGVNPGASVAVLIGQVVLENEDESPIGNWASMVRANGVLTTDQVFNASDRVTQLPSYDPSTHEGTRGDRLLMGEAIVRIQKLVQNPITEEYVDGVAPEYTSGGTVNYQLRPTLTAPVFHQDSTAEVIIEDCLPLHQVFVSATQDGEQVDPQAVHMGAAAGSELECDDNRQYVRWNLGELQIGEPIVPIIVSAEILETAINGVFTNDVLVSSPEDNSVAELRGDEAQVQLVVPTGIRIAKTVNKPSIEVNPQAVTNPRTLTWSVHFRNVDAPANVSNVDVIDVLPANGVNGNNFTGTLRFDSAEVAAGGGIEILTTKEAVGNLSADPADSTNAVNGSTVWCDAAGQVVFGEGSPADCAETNSHVTALRMLRDGPFLPADDFQVDIHMTPIGNASGDIYRNITTGNADGVTQSVGPATRGVGVIASTVGDRVWEDLNSNGIQDEGEPGVPHFPVSLTGTDVDGNSVELETVTDADGNYLFEELASGTYVVTFSPNGLNSNTTFTAQHAGTDQALDSDADPQTGQSSQFELGENTGDLRLDAGVVIDRNFALVLDKQFVEATELDDSRRSTVTYMLEVRNEGTAEGTYDLEDEVQFSDSITIDSVTVANVTPGGIATLASFDGVNNTLVAEGVTLAGGATHIYEVTVEATLTTEFTVEQAECYSVETELGGGYLNEATLTFEGVTVTNRACGDVQVPPAPDEPSDPPTTEAGPPTPPLSLTGFGGGLLIWAALAAVLVGTILLAMRGRQSAH